MNQLPELSTTPSIINAYWKFAANPENAGKMVLEAHDRKIKIGHKLSIGCSGALYFDKERKIKHADANPIVDHFKEALATEYGATFRDLFSETQEEQARCYGLSHEIVKEVAHQAAQRDPSADIHAYWQFAANSENAGKLVVEAKGNKLCFSDNPDFHLGSTEGEMRLVDHHAVVKHFKNVLCNKYGREVLRNLFSKAQEEEALYSGLTYDIVKQVAENAKVVELFRDLKSSHDEVVKALKCYNTLPSSAAVGEQGEAELQLGKSMLRYHSLVSTFKKMAAADPANVIFQIKLKSSYLTLNEMTPLEVVQLLFRANDHLADAEKLVRSPSDTQGLFSQEGNAAKAQKYQQQASEAWKLLSEYAKDPESPEEVKVWWDEYRTI